MRITLNMTRLLAELFVSIKNKHSNYAKEKWRIPISLVVNKLATILAKDDVDYVDVLCQLSKLHHYYDELLKYSRNEIKSVKEYAIILRLINIHAKEIHDKGLHKEPFWQ